MNYLKEKNLIVEFVENNCGVDDLVENCDIAKVNTVVNVNQLTQKHGDVKNLDGGNYGFLVLGDFISDIDELNYGVSNKKWVDIVEFFDKADQAKKLFEKYKFRSLSRVKMKLITNNKIKLHVSYVAIEICKEIVTRDGTGPASISRVWCNGGVNGAN